MFVPPLDDLDLKAEFTSVSRERYKDGDPDDYLTEIRGVLLLEDEHGKGTPIGSATCHYIDITNGTIEKLEHSVFDLFDCLSDEYAAAYGALFDPVEDDYWDEFADAFALGFNILVIDEVKLDRQDSHIPIRFLKLIVDINAPGAGVVIAFKDSGLSERVLDAMEFFPSPRVPGVFILNRGAPFQGATLKARPAPKESTFQ